MELYEKVTSKSGRVTYREHTTIIPDGAKEMTNEQMVTMAVSIGITCLMMMERLLPAHKLNHRKIKAVEESILNLSKGLGASVDQETVDYWIDTWNKTMAAIQAGRIC